MERKRYKLTVKQHPGQRNTLWAVKNLTEQELREATYSFRQRGEVLVAKELPPVQRQADTFGGGGGNKAASFVDAGPCPGCPEHCGKACPNSWDTDEEQRRYGV